MLVISSCFHDSAMAGCLGGRQRLAGAKPLDGHLPTKASQRLAGCRRRLIEKGSTRPRRGVAVREPRANAAADLLSQGPAAAAAAGGGGASSVARPLSSSSSCVVVRRVSSVVCRRLSLSVVVGCAVVFCRLSPVVSSSSKTMTMMVRH